MIQFSKNLFRDWLCNSQKVRRTQIFGFVHDNRDIYKVLTRLKPVKSLVAKCLNVFLEAKLKLSMAKINITMLEMLTVSF